MPDPARSSYADFLIEYARKARAFYAELAIASAIWAKAESELFEHFESDKPIEYLLEVEERRIAAYVDDASWAGFLKGTHEKFAFSTIPASFGNTSLLVAAPILPNEMREVRCYRRSGAGQGELVWARQHLVRDAIGGSSAEQSPTDRRLRVLEDLSAIDQQIGLGYEK